MDANTLLLSKPPLTQSTEGIHHEPPKNLSRNLGAGPPRGPDRRFTTPRNALSERRSQVAQKC